MARDIGQKPEWVELWGGWKAIFVLCGIERLVDGGFVARAKRWIMEINIVEIDAKEINGQPVSKELLASSKGLATNIHGKGWIGNREQYQEDVNGVRHTRVAATLYGDSSILVCTVSFVDDEVVKVADFLINSIEWQPRATKVSTYSRPGECDRLLLDAHRQFIRELLESNGLASELQSASGKLGALRSIIAAKCIAPDKTSELTALGTIFGDAFVTDPDFHWTVFTENEKPRTVVRYKNTSICINAYQILAKRLERGQSFDVLALYSGLKSKVLEVAQTKQAKPG